MSRDFLKMQHISIEEAKARAISKLMGKKDKKPEASGQQAPAQKKISLPPAEASYANKLKLNRSYDEYMRSFTSESPGVLQPLMPSPKPGSATKAEDLFAKDEEAEQQKRVDRERLKRSLKLKDEGGEKFRKISASKSIVQKDEPIWCARCNTRHSPDFHKQPAKPRPIVPRPPKVPQRRQEVIDISSDDESDLSDFIVDEGLDARQVSSAIRKLTGYDPRKYRDDESDEDMEAGVEDILAEERRTARIGRREDEEELRKLIKKSKTSA